MEHSKKIPRRMKLSYTQEIVATRRMGTAEFFYTRQAACLQRDQDLTVFHG